MVYALTAKMRIVVVAYTDVSVPRGTQFWHYYATKKKRTNETYYRRGLWGVHRVTE